MAFKFSKQDIKDRDDVVDAARKKLGILNGAIEQFNADVAEKWAEVEEALNDYNGAISDAYEFVDRVKTEFNDAYEEKSEKWQEGDRGSAAREWIDSFDSVELEQVEMDAPEPLEEVSGEGLDALENLETEAA